MKKVAKFVHGLRYLKNHVLMETSRRTGRVLGKPNVVSIEITTRCDSRCAHCDTWKKQDPHELSAEVLERLFIELGDWLGSYGLTMSGGEPFIRSDLLELCSVAMGHGATVNILTNGMHFSEAKIREVCERGVQRLAISVDGYGENHDHVRGIPGLFAKIEEAIETFKQYDAAPIITIQSVITRHNLGNMPDLVDWVGRHGLNGILFQALVPNFGSECHDERWFETSPLWPVDFQDLEGAIHELLRLQEAGGRVINSPQQLQRVIDYTASPILPFSKGRKCGAGSSAVSIGGNGDVLFCHQLGIIGNILETPIREMWYSAEADAMHQHVRDCQKNCSILNCYAKENILQKAVRYLKYH